MFGISIRPRLKTSRRRPWMHPSITEDPLSDITWHASFSFILIYTKDIKYSVPENDRNGLTVRDPMQLPPGRPAQ